MVDYLDLDFGTYHIVCIAITALFWLIGMSLHFFSLIKALRLKSVIIRTDLVVVIQAIHFVVGVVTIFHSVMDTTTSIAELAVEVLLSFAFFAFLIYTMECLAMILKSKIKDSFACAIGLIEDEGHREIMISHPFPDPQVGYWGKMKLLKMYAAYWYILNGYSKYWFCRRHVVKDFKSGWRVVNKTYIFFFIYLITNPMILVAIVIITDEYDPENFKIKNIQLTLLLKLLTFIVTILAVPRISAFATSFKELYPFLPSPIQFLSIIGVKISRNVILFWTENVASAPSYLSMAIFSLFYFLMALISLKAFNPNTIMRHRQKDYKHSLDTNKESLVSYQDSSSQGMDADTAL